MSWREIITTRLVSTYGHLRKDEMRRDLLGFFINRKGWKGEDGIGSVL